jgi:DNA-binding NtrC family response regulator
VPEPQIERSEAVHGHRLCIVMVCEDIAEAARVGQILLQVNSGSLITYCRAEDLIFNCPRGRIALIILANRDQPEAMERIIDWLRRQWPHCPVVVIGDAGSRELELAARKGGATYLVRPVSPDEWGALLGHALTVKDQVASKERLG